MRYWQEPAESADAPLPGACPVDLDEARSTYQCGREFAIAP
jgi:hypothetical protein